jgi:hypothetical protein
MPQSIQADMMNTEVADTDTHLRKFQKELSAGTVSLVLLAVLAG